jgi:hypothetical protein
VAVPPQLPCGAVLAAGDLHQQLRGGARRILDPSEAGARGGGELGADSAGGHAVIAWPRELVGVAEGLGRAARVGGERTDERQERHVAADAAAGTGQMGQAEAGNLRIVVPIAAAGRAAGRIRAPLDHTERNGRSGKGVDAAHQRSTAAAAQERIDERSWIVYRDRIDRAPRWQQRRVDGANARSRIVYMVEARSLAPCPRQGQQAQKIRKMKIAATHPHPHRLLHANRFLKEKRKEIANHRIGRALVLESTMRVLDGPWVQSVF